MLHGDGIWIKLMLQGMQYCEVFCQVTLFPRLQDFIMNQDWNDPKSKLQQCCLTLRTMDGGEPDIPVYKYETENIFLFYLRNVPKIR